ncbi:MAG TPA: FAD-dependent monooxygenase [Pseudonocardiaceae bacterium]
MSGPARATVVVAGGGIGGLAVAGVLGRAGWRVVVLERAPEFAPVGAGIALPSNAVRALDRLGLGERLRRRAAIRGPAELRTPRGRRLAHAPTRVPSEDDVGAMFALHRADLHHLLRDGARDAELRTGHRVVDVREDAERVVVAVETAAGPDELVADLLVGADGVDSVVRPAVVAGHPGPSHAGYVAWRAVVEAEAATRIGVPDLPVETWGRGRRFGIVPLADGRVYWYATASGPPGTGSGAALPAVAARFADWHPPIPELLAATRPEALLRHDIRFQRHPLPTYVTRRVVLVGDAAHAMSPDLGQGGAQALEDAVVLAALLGAPGGDVPAALAAYDAARRPRTQRLVRLAARAARLAQLDGPAAGLRDAVLPLVPAGVLQRQARRILGWTPPDLGPVVG